MAGMSRTQFHAVLNSRPRGHALALLWLLPLAVSEPMSSTARAAPPACLASLDAHEARVAGVHPGATLHLADGRTVKIEGLLWPSEFSIRRQSAAIMDRLSGGQVVLRVALPKFDRYGRLRAHLILPDGAWLERELLRRGLARVQIAPDRPECAAELYAAEAEARAVSAGLWALPQYAVRTPESLRWRDLGAFQIVEGQVLNVKVSGRAYLNFGRNWRKDLTVTISPEDLKNFRRAGLDPHAYAGKRVRVHGYLDRMNGFEIEAGSPGQIEVVK